MLSIRMQRTGRKGHAHFRVVVQDAHRSPTSGKVVALIGNYNPHTKDIVINKEKAAFYLEHGAQPSPRVVSLFTSEGIAMPSWVKEATVKTGKIRNPEKLRVNQPKEEAPEIVDEVVADSVEPVEEIAEKAPVEEAPVTEETPAE